MARGYVGNAEASERHFRDGWFYPGAWDRSTPRGA
jgi:hypothetical protein